MYMKPFHSATLSTRPLLGQVVDLDLVLCTEFDLEYAIYSLMIETLSKAMNAALEPLVCNRFLKTPLKMPFFLLRNRSKFEDVAFRGLLALGHQTLHRGEH